MKNVYGCMWNIMNSPRLSLLPAFLPDVLSQHRTINFLRPTYGVVKEKKNKTRASVPSFRFTAIVSNTCLCSRFDEISSHFHAANLINKAGPSKRSKSLEEQMFEIVRVFFFCSLPHCQLATCEIRHLEKSDLEIYGAGEARRPAGFRRTREKEERKEAEETQGCILGPHLLPWKSSRASRALLSRSVLVLGVE